jgi:hypothetical protein
LNASELKNNSHALSAAINLNLRRALALKSDCGVAVLANRLWLSLALRADGGVPTADLGRRRCCWVVLCQFSITFLTQVLDYHFAMATHLKAAP